MRAVRLIKQASIAQAFEWFLNIRLSSFFEPSSYFCCIFVETPTLLLFFPTLSSFFTENHDNWNQKHIAKVSRVMMLSTLLSINECSSSKCFFWSKKSCLSHVLLRLLILSFHLGPLESLYCSLVIIQGTTVSAGCKCRGFFFTSLALEKSWNLFMVFL